MRTVWALSVVLLLVGGTAQAQQRYDYDITIRRLNTAEQQLLYEYNRAIDMRKFDIEHQLEAIRAQRLEVERIRAGAAQPAPVVQQTVVVQPAAAAQPAPAPAPASPPPPDWKQIEKPHVVLKGIMKTGDKYSALVSGGQIVKEGDLFITTYKGEDRWWKVLGVTATEAKVQRVDEKGKPLKDAEPLSVGVTP